MRNLQLLNKWIFGVVFLFISSCNNIDYQNKYSGSSNFTNDTILEVATKVIEAFKAGDGKKLALLVHPEKGVRFSPSAYIDISNDLVFTRSQINSFWTDEKNYLWGFADGTGDPINLTPRQYCKRFILDRDFSKPSSINVNDDQAEGNISNNASTIYPSATRVEFYIAPHTRDGEQSLDWAALRLILEKNSEKWSLIAVIHEEWSI